jgi:hypothetical protein
MFIVIFCFKHLATIGPRALIAPLYSSSFSTFLRNRLTSDCSVKSTSFGHPPSTCLMLEVFVTILSVFASCSDLCEILIYQYTSVWQLVYEDFECSLGAGILTYAVLCRNRQCLGYEEHNCIHKPQKLELFLVFLLGPQKTDNVFQNLSEAWCTSKPTGKCELEDVNLLVAKGWWWKSYIEMEREQTSMSAELSKQNHGFLYGY